MTAAFIILEYYSSTSCKPLENTKSAMSTLVFAVMFQ